MKRFPDYYMFRLTEEEWNNWKSQFVTSNYMSEDEIQAIKMGVRSLKVSIQPLFWRFEQ